MTEIQQVLMILLSSLKGGDLPIKLSVDGSEWVLFYNETTKRIEKYKNSILNNTQEWSKYEGDFSTGTGTLTLGNVNGSPSITLDQTTGIASISSGELFSETIRASSEIISEGDLNIEGDFNVVNLSGSAQVKYEGVSNVLLNLPETDGIIALLSDIPNISNGIEIQNEIGQGVIVSIGDYSDANEGTKLIVNDSTEEITLKADSGINLESQLFAIRTINAKGGLFLSSSLNPNRVSLNNSNLTSPRNVQFQDKNGTIAFLSDLPNSDTFVDRTTAQTISGSKTFTDNTIFDNGLQMSSSVTGSIANDIRGGVFQNSNNRLQFYNTTDNVTQARNWVFNSDNLTVNKRVYELPDVDGRLLTANSTPDWTGWAQYGDSQYTSLTPLVTLEGQISIIDLDGLQNTVKSQLPIGVSDFYDVSTSKIVPVNNGDGYSLSLSYKASNTSNNGDFTIFLDIGGTFTRIFPDVKRTPRGQNVAHEFVSSINYYTLGTFLANGGLLKIESGTGTTSLYDISLQIHKTHNAR